MLLALASLQKAIHKFNCRMHVVDVHNLKYLGEGIRYNVQKHAATGAANCTDRRAIQASRSSLKHDPSINDVGPHGSWYISV